MLRTDRTDLAAAEVWQLYVLLARIERSFRYLKSTLGIRPVFHQRTERVDAHIFISLLAYHLVHTIERRLQENRLSLLAAIRDLLAIRWSIATAPMGRYAAEAAIAGSWQRLPDVARLRRCQDGVCSYKQNDSQPD